jgi:hypothetical protein
MNGPTGLRFLRPYLYHDIAPVKPAAYARFFANTTPWLPRAAARETLYAAKVRHFTEAREVRSSAEEASISRGHYEARLEKLEKADALHYPRMQRLPSRISVKTFNEKYASLQENDTRKENITLCGKKIRLLTKSQLMFL